MAKPADFGMSKREMAHELHALRTHLLHQFDGRRGLRAYVDTAIMAIAADCGIALQDLKDAQNRAAAFTEWVDRTFSSIRAHLEQDRGY